MASMSLMVFSLGITLFQMTSCKKATAQISTPTLTKQQILSEKIWRVDELHSVINGTYASYYTGGTNNTGEAYENMRYTFNADGTGTYIDQFNASHSIQWEFTTGDLRNMRFTIDGTTVQNWQMVEIAGNYMHITENFTVGGNSNCMHSYRLVQIP